VKADSKDTSGQRKSARQAAAGSKPIYDEKEIDKIVLGTKADSKGAINVMLA
jgi:hypothetical protein